MRTVVPFQLRTLLAAAVSLSIVISIVLPATGEDSEPRERVVVMKSGRVLSGFASRNAGGWLLEQSNGRVQVPVEEISVVADSLVDAYRQQRDSVVKPTPATHMALAHWCITYRLQNEARDEVRQCLKLDAEHTAARKLLRRLDEILNPNDTKSIPKEPVTRRTADGFLVPDAESLGGLSTDAAAAFTQRIQPLLMNKCGNASCHGTTGPVDKLDGFHLIPVRNGSNAHRLYAERNLAAVMRYVDVEEPSLSPLVTLPQGSHGGTAGVFHGTSGNAQIKALRAWIKTVAEEKQAEDRELKSRPSLAAKGRKPLNGPRVLPDPLDDDMERSVVANPKPAKSDSMPLPIAANTMKGRPVPKADFTSNHSLAQGKAVHGQVPPERDTDDIAGADDRPSDDPFDPDIFNRRFHSSPRR